MKTTMIKAAFICALLSAGGAIGLAASSKSAFPNPSSVIERATKNESANPGNIYTWVQHNLDCPGFVTTDDEANRVELWLRVDDKGLVEVINTKSANKELCSYVIDQINGKTCDTNGADSDYHFVIRFRRIG